MACAAVLAVEPDPRGDFPAWLATRGMKPTFADAMERELGISDYEELLACAEDTQVTAELLGAARDRLPFAFYAVLRRLVRALAPRQQQRRWWRQRRRNRRRGPGLPSGNVQEERVRDDDGGGDEEDEELGGCASRCEGVLASRAVLDAIVATLSSLSRELLQSAQRFRGLEPALVRVTPATCDGRRSPSSPGPPEAPAASVLSPPPALSRTRSPPAGIDYVSPQFDSSSCFGRVEPCVAWREIKLEKDDDGRSGGNRGNGFSPRSDAEAEVATVAEHEASGSWLGKTEHEEEMMAHWQVELHSHSGNYEDPVGIVPQHATPSGQNISSHIPNNDVTHNWVDPDVADLAASAVGSGDNCDFNDRFPTAGIRRGMAPCSFQCRDCGLTFGQRQQLRAHRIKHTTSRPHCCRLCGKGFTKAYNLSVHMRTHTGEKPFLCSQCNATFRLKHHLQAHQKTHVSDVGATHHTQQVVVNHQRQHGHLKTHTFPGQRSQVVAQHHLVQVQLKTQVSEAALSGGGGPVQCSAGAYENTAF